MAPRAPLRDPGEARGRLNGSTPRYLVVCPLGDISSGLAPLLRILCARRCVGSAPAPGVGSPGSPVFEVPCPGSCPSWCAPPPGGVHLPYTPLDPRTTTPTTPHLCIFGKTGCHPHIGWLQGRGRELGSHPTVYHVYPPLVLGRQAGRCVCCPRPPLLPWPHPRQHQH